MNLDVSVAPEIAQALLPPATLAPNPVVSRTPTVGELAGQLRCIAAAPEQWWAQVRFDPRNAVRIPLPGSGPFRVWLLILPPAGPSRPACTCAVMTVVAGEVAASPVAAPLAPGRIRVHGAAGHQIVNRGTGYSVSLHAASR